VEQHQETAPPQGKTGRLMRAAIAVPLAPARSAIRTGVPGS
jgi:hypothetical protein